MPGADVTHWTSKTELFMEYPLLVAGRTALFAVHLTRLDDFSPVRAGRASLEFSPEGGGAGKTIAGPPAPARPGAFRIEDTPPAPGQYRWALVLEGPDVSDRHELGRITVFADDAGGQGRRGRRGGRRSHRHQLPEGTAVDQPVRHGDRRRRRTCAPRCARL